MPWVVVLVVFAIGYQLVISLGWWGISLTAVATLAILARNLRKCHLDERAAVLAKRAVISARADEQHASYLAGRLEGLYGEYMPHPFLMDTVEAVYEASKPEPVVSVADYARGHLIESWGGRVAREIPPTDNNPGRLLMARVAAAADRVLDIEAEAMHADHDEIAQLRSELIACERFLKRTAADLGVDVKTLIQHADMVVRAIRL